MHFLHRVKLLFHSAMQQYCLFLSLLLFVIIIITDMNGHTESHNAAPPPKKLPVMQLDQGYLYSSIQQGQQQEDVFQVGIADDASGIPFGVIFKRKCVTCSNTNERCIHRSNFEREHPTQTSQSSTDVSQGMQHPNFPVDVDNAYFTCVFQSSYSSMTHPKMWHAYETYQTQLKNLRNILKYLASCPSASLRNISVEWSEKMAMDLN